MLATLISGMFLKEGDRPLSPSDFMLEDLGNEAVDQAEAPPALPEGDVGTQDAETLAILGAMRATPRERTR